MFYRHPKLIMSKIKLLISRSAQMCSFYFSVQFKCVFQVFSAKILVPSLILFCLLFSTSGLLSHLDISDFKVYPEFSHCLTSHTHITAITSKGLLASPFILLQTVKTCFRSCHFSLKSCQWLSDPPRVKTKVQLLSAGPSVFWCSLPPALISYSFLVPGKRPPDN